MKKYKKSPNEDTSNNWEPEDFENSSVTEELRKHSDKKFLPVVSLIFLLKCLAVVSCKLERPRLSILHVAPSRSLKTFTSNEAMRIFDNEFWLNLQSDFSMNSLKRYKKKLRQNVCLFINDGSTLFASKAQRFKDRLVGGLSELLADEVYVYQDYRKKFTLQGQITLVMNMTSESYQNNKDRLLGLTFTERLLTLHHVLSESDMRAWVEKRRYD